MRHKLYDCGICGGLHHWNFNGDCRQDGERYGDAQDYAERNGVSEYDIDVVEWDERVEADELSGNIPSPHPLSKFPGVRS